MAPLTKLLPDGSIAKAYENFVALSRYARWLPIEKRRETWSDSVDRYVDFMIGHVQAKHDFKVSDILAADLRTAIREHHVMPSMRALMTAGPALDRSNIAGFNCAYTPIDDINSLWEVLYILMNGTGVGYSVERRYVGQLPPVPAEINWHPNLTIMVGDSKEGWAHAFRELLEAIWLRGEVPHVDLSGIRPAGSRLETFGGRASGPEPLRELFAHTANALSEAAGRQLRPIEVHDLVCKVASVVVVGGVRRAAMIALSDLDDTEMATAKSGEWWVDNPQRALANISAVYDDGVTEAQFREEWANLVESGSGERGIFNRSAAQRQAAKYGRRDPDADYGCNPCSEILLKPRSFCNLSTVIVDPDDDMDRLVSKVSLATILGTLQATLTEYPLLRDEWRTNAEEERLLGVSLNGVYGNRFLFGPGRTEVLSELRQIAQFTNTVYAQWLGIPVSHAITTVKPEGTTSQLAGVSSGIHPWHSAYYVRTIRADSKDPLARLMVDYGVPHEADVANPTNLVFSFPISAPQDAITRDDITAIDHLELWLDYQTAWCDHKPSVTVNVRPDEWAKVADWVWDHIADVSGIAFLPYADHTYAQAPYQEITRERYEALLQQFPEVRWADLPFYELADATESAQTLACSASGCEI